METPLSNTIKRDMKKLLGHLSKHEITDNSKVNLVAVDLRKKYNLNVEGHKEFIKLYSKLVNKIDLHFAEIPNDISYLKFDIDLEAEMKPKKRLYDNKMLKELNKLILESVKSYLKVDKKDMIVFVMEKDEVNKKNDIYRDGFHLCYPYIVQTNKIRNAIFDDIYNRIKESGIFKGDLSKILDKNASIGSTAWMLLGSSKVDGNKYMITKILNYKCKEVEMEDSSMMDKVDLLSVLNDNLILEHCCELKEGVDIKAIEMKYIEKSNITDDIYIPNSGNRDIEEARILTKLLSVSRAENHDDWLKVGFCLHNIDKSLLGDWIEFSKLCPSKFKNGDCEKRWYKMKTGQDMLTIRSLHLWAKQDNYSDYMNYRNIEYNNLFKQTMAGDHQNVAKAIYYKYQTEFVCAGIKTNSWYQFIPSRHHWEEIDSGYSLKEKITTDFIKDYSEMNARNYQLFADTTDKTKQQEIMEEIKRIQMLINRLSNEAFLGQLMSACGRKFYMKGFMEQLDENYDIIGFNNGVYDLKKKEFRAGIPEDYITMSCGLDYQKYDSSSDEIKEVMRLFKDIHPDDKTREYVYTFLSTLVSGHHKEETLHLFTGCGSNGKSVTFELLKYCFGDYFMSVPITLLTRKRGGAENASPMLAKLKGKRLGVLQEPEEGERLSVGLMKELTGNDEITARGMFKEPTSFKPQIKFAIPCNNLPEVPARDKGTWRRLRVIQHESEFVDFPDPSKKNQKKKDVGLKDKLENYASQFLSFLINRYLTVYEKEGLKICESVDYATQLYNQDNNCLKQYVDNKLSKTGNKSDKIKFMSIWEDFKNYFKEEFDGVKRPQQRELFNYLKTNLDCSGKMVVGYIFEGEILDEDDNDEN